MRYEDFRLRVEKVLGDDLSLDPREARAILELAYLAMSSDRVLAAAEMEAFQHVASVLRDKAVFSLRPPPSDEEPVDLDLGEPETFELIGNLARALGSGPEAIRKAATKLKREEARAAAYKVAFAITLVDFETTEEEIELDDVLAEALGFDDARAQVLETSVYAVLETPPGG